MIKTLTNLFKQDKEKFVVPKGVQDVIPIKAIYDDGIFQVGKDKFSNLSSFLGVIITTIAIGIFVASYFWGQKIIDIQ